MLFEIQPQEVEPRDSGNITLRKLDVYSKIKSVDELEDLRNLSTEEGKSREELKLELESLLKQEEVLWKQCSCNS